MDGLLVHMADALCVPWRCPPVSVTSCSLESLPPSLRGPAEVYASRRWLLFPPKYIYVPCSSSDKTEDDMEPHDVWTEKRPTLLRMNERLKSCCRIGCGWGDCERGTGGRYIHMYIYMFCVKIKWTMYASLFKDFCLSNLTTYHLYYWHLVAGLGCGSFPFHSPMCPTDFHVPCLLGKNHFQRHRRKSPRWGRDVGSS